MSVRKYMFVLIVLLLTVISCSEDDGVIGVWQSYDNPPYISQYQFESSSYVWDLFLTNSSGPVNIFGISGNYGIDGQNIVLTPLSDYVLTNAIWTNVLTTNVGVSIAYSLSGDNLILESGSAYSNYVKFAY